jgi:hypothetical protein
LEKIKEASKNTRSQEVRISTNIVGYALHLLISLQYKVKAFCVYAVRQQSVYDVNKKNFS